MKLVSPSGVKLSVSDDRGEKLLSQGYRRADVKAPAPVSVPEPAKPRRRRKATTEEA